MYITPVLFPDQSNREDFLNTVGLFDDMTGQPIDVSGRTLAAPGDFTGSAWNVSIGSINTTSTSTLVIKDYPINAEMQAVALTVGTNLAIVAGSFVVISDPTGLNTMYGYVISYAPVTGAMVCQVGCAFDFEIRSHHHRGLSCDYGPYQLMGSDISDHAIITAQLGSGVTIIDIGVIQIRIAAAVMNKLRHRTYNVGMIAFNGFDTRQLFIGKLPMLYGGVASSPFAPAASSNPFGLP